MRLTGYKTVTSYNIKNIQTHEMQMNCNNLILVFYQLVKHKTTWNESCTKSPNVFLRTLEEFP